MVFNVHRFFLSPDRAFNRASVPERLASFFYNNTGSFGPRIHHIRFRLNRIILLTEDSPRAQNEFRYTIFIN